MVTWETKTIGECAEIVSGGTPSTTVPQFWDGGVLWCTPTDITRAKSKYLSETERTLTDMGLQKSAAVLLPVGAILLCSRATIGEMSIAKKPISTNQGFKNLICNENVDNEFLYYLLQTKRKAMLEQAIGSTFLEISKKALSGIEISLPPLLEQRAVAAALSDVDGYIAALERLIAKKRNIKQGAMQELLTGKRRLPGFSDEWVEKTLGDICEIKDGTHGTFSRVDNGVPLLSAKNIFDNELRIGDESYISKADYETIVSCGFPLKKDILLSCVGTIGRCCIYTGQPIAAFQRSVAFIRSRSVSPVFLLYLLQSSMTQRQLTQSANASAQGGVYLGALAKIEIAYPFNTEEQDAVAAILSDMDAEIDALTAKLNKARNIKQGMMQELLTGRIRLVECGSVLPLSKRRQAAALQTEARYE